MNRTRTPKVGLALMPDESFRRASSSLFESGAVDAVEWTLDATWAAPGYRVPAWVDAVLDAYAGAGRLYGHGVTFSTLSAAWEPRQEEWLRRLAGELGRRRYVHVSEHFGFMSTPDFLPGAPLPVPMTDGAVRVGRQAIARLAEVVGAPVGLENLAPVFGRRDADDQGDFLEALLAPTEGFVILDLHNVYCQAVSLGVPARSLVARMPLARVRELHVAGGTTWTAACAPDRAIRRDTHDAPVPDEVMDLVAFALDACPGVEVVFLERFTETLQTNEEAERFCQDYRRLLDVVQGACADG
jgi:uncharacterized protein (UPF0276 family)